MVRPWAASREIADDWYWRAKLASAPQKQDLHIVHTCFLVESEVVYYVIRKWAITFIADIFAGRKYSTIKERGLECMQHGTHRCLLVHRRRGTKDGLLHALYSWIREMRGSSRGKLKAQLRIRQSGIISYPNHIPTGERCLVVWLIPTIIVKTRLLSVYIVYMCNFTSPNLINNLTLAIEELVVSVGQRAIAWFHANLRRIIYLRNQIGSATGIGSHWGRGLNQKKKKKRFVAS